MSELENKSNNQITKKYSDMWLYILLGFSLCQLLFLKFSGMMKISTLSIVIDYLIWISIAKKFHHKFQFKMNNFLSALISFFLGLAILFAILIPLSYLLG